MVRIRIDAPVHATEDPAKVRQAASILPGQVEEAADAVQVHATDPAPLRKRIWELRIIDTMRGAMLAGTQGPHVRFALAKQAAFAGRLSLPPSPHALGDLRIQMEVEPGDPWRDGEALVWWLCPETKDGEIVGPVDSPDAS